ncbi:hypothetical protein NE857_09095 [Nocardiopsis exhalans]|uniref:Uncharacterized protein n=1 Tax=Nocardiopsis exhalans TaxID=163604 RepID=A0ABY5DE30_9ACTN|nr:hypothetical protein [Nocardiopsis exhalans]USY21738.1 hypothetical protein NE857_09095 [Nocardiopsis exhalans]
MRYWFGGQPSDYVIAPGEQLPLGDDTIGYQPLLVPGISLWVYDYDSGERLIDLLDDTGSPNTELRTSDYGLIPRFRGPDEVQRALIGPAPLPENDQGEEENTPGRWVVTSSDWPTIIAQVNRRVTRLEDEGTDGGDDGEIIATAHPMLWSQAGELQARASPHRYVNLEGRTQIITRLRAEAGVSEGQVDVHLLAVDLDTGSTSIIAAVSLTEDSPASMVSPEVTISVGTGVTVEVVLSDDAVAEDLTVQVMIR